MGGALAEKIRAHARGARHRRRDPDSRLEPPVARSSSRNRLGVKYREGFVKNRYIGRTFIMPGPGDAHEERAPEAESRSASSSADKVVLLVDDSIVRGTTSREIVHDGARSRARSKVYFASASPPVRYPNVYGIDMPNQHELVATGRTEAEIAREIGADLAHLPGPRSAEGGGARRQSEAQRISRRRASTASTSPATSPPTTCRSLPSIAYGTARADGSRPAGGVISRRGRRGLPERDAGHRHATMFGLTGRDDVATGA